MRFKEILILIGYISISIFATSQKNLTNSFFLDEISESEKGHSSNTNFRESQLTSNYDVSYYRLQLNVDPGFQYIYGSVVTHFTPDTNITQIVFELNSVLTVDSILNKTNHLPFQHDENAISITGNFSASTIDSITIFYHGSPPIGPTFQTEMHNNIPVLWTLSEPYGAIDWWPCKQSLTDKADSIDVFVTAPKENRVAGNGILQSITNSGNNSTTHWKNSYPIVPYLIAIAVTPYSEISFTTNLSKGPLLVQNYIYSEDSATFHTQLFTTDTLLRFYDSLIGAYPFMDEKYGHAQFGRGGGMEHQTMSFMTHFSFGLTAHELAHQWFGNKITCGSWADIWLNEGFATYFAGLPLETMYNGTQWTAWKENFLERATTNKTESVYVIDTSSVNRIFDSNLSYAKGGYILHMLRKQVGDSAFFNGVRAYLSDPDLAYKTALTQDFFSHIEQQADTNLSLFMNQWIYGVGYPSFNLEWEQINRNVSLKLRQTTNTNQTPVFNISVPVLLVGESDSLWISVPFYANEVSLQRQVDFTINRVIIDPELDIISKGNFVIRKSSFSELTIYPNPVSANLHVIPEGDFKTINAYSIFNSAGKLIHKVENVRFSNTINIDIQHLAQGNYQLQLESGNKKKTQGFVISR